MRIERLDLVRYGRFTGRSIEFGPEPTDGAPDLHVVFGPNEAGKSTLFAAWLDLVFGDGRGDDAAAAPHYAFEHPLETLEVAARVSADGATHEVARSFGKGGSLSTEGDSGFAADALASAVGSLGRRAYATMFSLDAAVLERGGQEVLSSQGRLGELLFSSNAGLSGLTGVMGEAREEADALYRKGAKRTAAKPTELRRLQAEIERLDEAIREADTDVAAHERLVGERDGAEAAHRAAEAEHAAARAAQARAERQLRALDADDERRAAEADLAALGALPPTPADGAERLAALAATAARLDERERALARRRAEMDAAWSDVSADPDALELAPLVDGLADPASKHSAGAEDGDADGEASIVSRAETAEADLPRRRAELAEADAELRGRLSELGHHEGGDVEAAVRSVLPAGDAVAALTRLAKERAAIAAGLQAAARALDEAARAEAEAAEAVREAGEADAPTAEAVAALERLVRRVRREAPGAALGHAERALAQARARVAPLLERVGASDPAHLDRLAPPGAATLARWRERERSLEAAERERAARRAEMERERAGLLARAAALDVPGTDDVAAARAAREGAWAAHRAALGTDASEETARAFERALADDDALTERRLGALERTAERRAAERRAAELAAQIATLEGEADPGAREAHDAEIGAALESVLPLAGMAGTLATLEDFVARHGEAVRAVEALAALEGDEALARAVADRAASELGAALAALEEDAEGDADDLAERAEAWCTRAGQRLAATERTRSAHERTLDEVRRRQHEADRMADEDARWRSAWRAAAAACTIPADDAREPDTDAALDRIEALRALAERHARRTDLAKRVASMEADRATLLERLAGIEAKLGTEADGARTDPWPLRLARLRERVATARTTALAVERLEVERRTVDGEARGLADAAAGHEAERAALAAALGVEDFDAMRGMLDRMARRDRAVERRDRALEAIRREGLTVGDMATLDRDAVGEAARRLREGEPALHDAVGAARDALTLARRALDEIGGDGRAARLVAERETLLTQMAEAARRAVALRLGVRAAERALHDYRARHRSGMMQRASDAFAAMSCGHFSGLGTSPDGKGEEVLHALRSTGHRVDVPSRRDGGGLSTGTRHQLYLALRVAGYHEFAARRAPPPFVCDDVLETFDDERAAATLRQFEGMARHGQVVLLTHHAHIVALAERTVPGVRVHDLAPAPVPSLRIAAE